MANQRWRAGAVTQVTKSNFSCALQQIRDHIRDSDYIAVSSQKTGGGSRPWHRVLPIDTSHTAYLKAKLAAETYEIFQFAICPFRIDGSKVVAFPYNFHLFPRDELNMGMPSYSFSCQSSFLTSMAREGFDFNTCIYDGISYLSRVQESKAKERNTVPSICQVTPSLSFSAADTLFMERTKSRVQHWKNVCRGPSKTGEDALLTSLRKLIVGSELYGTRPCLTIDVCSSRQVQLATQALNQSFDDIVPIVIPGRDGGPTAVRAILTSSEGDKNLLVSELQHQEEEHDRRIRGFREVIDLMTRSHKAVVAYDCLNDFTFIHSKFLAPLPPSMSEFMCSLRFAFPNILDVNNLLKKIGPLRKAKNLPAAISYLRRQFFAPVDMEIPQDDKNMGMSHGHNVLRVTHVFAKLSSILNISPSSSHEVDQQTSSVEDYSNIFIPCCTGLQELEEEGVRLWTDDARNVSINNLVFIWGFRQGTSAGALKALLHGSHPSLSEDFELNLIDKSCAAVVFCQSGLADALLKDVEKGNLGSEALMNLVSDGLKVAGYEAYKRICGLGLWQGDFADCFDKSILHSTDDQLTDMGKDASEIYWPSEEKMTLNDL